MSSMNPKAPKSVSDARKRHQLTGFEPTPTVQAEKHKCCVNRIVANYRKTGIVDHIQEREGEFRSLPDVTDYAEAMNKVAQAQQSFESLPSNVRQEFNNNPLQFVKAIHDPEQHQKLVRLGLVKPRIEVEKVDSSQREPINAGVEESTSAEAETGV
jgi:phage internal scaffolding protein